MSHFKRYSRVVAEKKIRPANRWNFDETGFRVSIARNDYVVTIDPQRRIYLKCPDNRESLTSVECINGIGGDIPVFLILTGVQILAP